MENMNKKLREFKSWFGNLSVLDQNNFLTLINLPNALELIQAMKGNGGNEKYIDMALFALATKQVIESGIK